MRGCLSLVCFALSAFAQTGPGDYFEQYIRPLLAANCYPCHSAKAAKPMAGLLLDSRAGTLRGGASGVPAVVPGKPDESLIVTAVRQAGSLKMPPGRKLDSAQIDALVEWIRMGAPDPRTDGTPPATAAPYDFEKAKQHWAYGAIADPAAPAVTPAEWNGTAIDRFVKAKLDSEKLAPQPRASRLALIRRATYDLVGLPPTPEEIDAFLLDSSPKAFEKVVDRLLASQPYGEKWGRHWLDVVRYADTAGDNADFPVPDMYRYRNWVIAAFNRDQPYNQFLREQIAGDILAARLSDPAGADHEEYDEKIIATGYLANSRRFGSRAAEFHLTIDDTIDNLGKGILGLTVACARCHDHKFDAIPNADYYALYGIFKSTRYAHAGTEIYPHTYGFAALNPAQAAELKRYEDELSGLDNRIEDMKAGRIKFATPEEKKKAEQENRDRLKKLSAEYQYVPKAYAVSEGMPGDARILVRGEPKDLGPTVPRGFLTILGGQKLPADEKGSGRLELAAWVTDPKNPLTARVMVNRVWQWHFGRGIVATSDDFGERGDPPSHPELLDYLASRFIESGWSVKKLHRMIMLSRTYQAASGNNPADAIKDPKNAYLWRFNPRRLDAEEIRDSLLALAGNLDAAPGGEQPFPPEMSWRYTQHVPFLGADDQYATNKRSLYLMQQRIRRQPFLELFDGSDPNAETGTRPPTTTALQALYFMNDPFFHAQAAALAVRVVVQGHPERIRKPDALRVRLNYAFRMIYGRRPTDDELKETQNFLASAGPDDQAWPALMRVLLASNEFLTVD